MGVKNYELVCPECGCTPIMCKKGSRKKAGGYNIQRCCTCNHYLKK